MEDRGVELTEVITEQSINEKNAAKCEHVSGCF